MLDEGLTSGNLGRRFMGLGFRGLGLWVCGFVGLSCKITGLSK